MYCQKHDGGSGGSAVEKVHEMPLDTSTNRVTNERCKDTQAKDRATLTGMIGILAWFAAKAVQDE